ncbi:MAG: response regulator, partial [Planctomycetota bacterium]
MCEIYSFEKLKIIERLPMEPFILLVEDNEDDIALAGRAFKKIQKEKHLKIARNGQEALEIIFGKDNQATPNPFLQFILLDLNLPKISGKEVLKAVKSNEKTKMIPIIALTTSKEDQDLIECYQLGVNSYIL